MAQLLHAALERLLRHALGPELQALGDGDTSDAPKTEPVPQNFYIGFAITCAFVAGLLLWYYLGFDGEQYEILSMLVKSVMPLGVLTLVVLVITGLLVRNFIGERLVVYWEALLGRIPIVRSIYSSVKQVSDTILSPNGQAFRKAVLIQYPRQGSWTIAFLTGVPAIEKSQW